MDCSGDALHCLQAVFLQHHLHIFSTELQFHFQLGKISVVKTKHAPTYWATICNLGVLLAATIIVKYTFTIRSTYLWVHQVVFAA